MNTMIDNVTVTHTGNDNRKLPLSQRQWFITLTDAFFLSSLFVSLFCMGGAFAMMVYTVFVTPH